jgi:hypothetical protein
MENQLDVNHVIDEILEKYSVLLKESAMKSAYIKQLQNEINELKAPKPEDGK